MNRKLIFLNVVLVMVVAFAGVQLRRQWKSAKQREAARIGVPVKTLPVPAYQALPPQPPLAAAGYVEIAKKMLFDRTRDSTVAVEAAVVPPPPPPPPMPPLPVYHGLMNFGSDGPLAILSLGSAGHQAIHPGDMIGQFKLLAVNSEVISFEWNGETVRRNTSDLTGSARGVSQPQESAVRTEGPAASAAAPPREALKGPGEDFGTFRNCNVNDGNTDGAVVDGYRKVNYSTPFGQSCRWEPLRR